MTYNPSDPPSIRAVGKIALGDLGTAIVVAAETTAGITASIISGANTGSMKLQVNLPAGMVPDGLYKVLPVITTDGEAAAANATIICQIGGGRNTAGFNVNFREIANAPQGCNLEFVIVR